MEKIFTSVFQTHYLNFCPNRELVRTKFVNVTMKDIFTAGTEKLEKSADGKKFEVKNTPPETAKTQYLYAYDKEKKSFRPAEGGKDKPIDLQDLGGVLNGLTEMITHVDKLKAKEEAERLKLLEEKHAALIKLQEGFLGNANIPDSVKAKLTQRL